MKDNGNLRKNQLDPIGSAKALHSGVLKRKDFQKEDYRSKIEAHILIHMCNNNRRENQLNPKGVRLYLLPRDIKIKKP